MELKRPSKTEYTDITKVLRETCEAVPKADDLVPEALHDPFNRPVFADRDSTDNLRNWHKRLNVPGDDHARHPAFKAR